MIKFYNDDCFNVMQKLIDKNIKVDAVIADIPYGTTNCRWDSVLDLEKMWIMLKKLRKNDHTPIILFGQTPFDKILGASNIKELKYEWIWEKTQATGHLNAKKMPMKAHENILVFYKKLPVYNPIKTHGHKPVNGYTKYVDTQNNTEIYNEVKQEITGGGNTDRYPRSVLKFASDKQKSCIHSTQKPLALMEYLVKTYSNENDLILDFTAGSMTTGVACIKNNRGFIGIEKDEEIFEKGIQRLVGDK